MTVILNPVFNCPKNLLSFLDDKVSTGIYNFVSLILNVAPVGLLIPSTRGLFPCAATSSLYALLVHKHFSDQVKVKDTSQLFNGISSALQKLLKFCNGTTILTSSFSTLSPSNFPVTLVL